MNKNNTIHCYENLIDNLLNKNNPNISIHVKDDVTTETWNKQNYCNISSHIILPDNLKSKDGLQIFIQDNKDKSICELFDYHIIDATNNGNSKATKILIIDKMFSGKNLVIYYKTKCKCTAYEINTK